MLKQYMPQIFLSLRGYNGKKLVGDVLAGIIVAIIALPLSIALAIASGVEPVRGLYTAVFAGFVIALLGGSDVQVSGPTAAFATIVAGIVAAKGLSALALSTVFAGVILILLGFLGLGKFVKYIPPAITTGFTGGIAVTLVIGQLKDFFGLTLSHSPVETPEKLVEALRAFPTINITATLVGVSALFLLVFLPKILKKVPPSLIAVIVCAVAVALLKLDVNTIGTLYGELPTGLPAPALPDFSADAVLDALPDAATIAALAAIESLLSCVVADKMLGTTHNPNAELIAQGAGNISSAIFGGIPATGAIARTAANIKNGGRTPISAIVHAAVLCLVLVLLMPYAAMIPMPVIAAILFVVAYNMSEWRSFLKICKSGSLRDISVLLVTFILTVIFDLVVAIAAGICLSVLFFLISKIKVFSKDKKC